MYLWMVSKLLYSCIKLLRTRDEDIDIDMQGMETAEELAQNLGCGRVSTQQGRPEGRQGQSLQKLHHPLCQGPGQAGARPRGQGDRHGGPEHQVHELQLRRLGHGPRAD